MELQLTKDQQAAKEAYTHFLLDPQEHFFVISGYAGCGKSTLVKYLIQETKGVIDAIKLIADHVPDYEVVLTATTNKAAEALSEATGELVVTIHSFLSLRVAGGYGKTEQSIEMTRNSKPKADKIVFIDEASYIDPLLEGYITKLLKDCKVIYVGDPAQLTPVKYKDACIFKRGHKEAKLSQVVRQAAGNPIIELATKFRETVNTGEFFSFVPDGVNVAVMNRSDFEDAIIKEMNRPDWQFKDSKVLAWRNSQVVAFNEAIRNHIHGDPKFQVGDYVNVNSYMRLASGVSYKTDQLVKITDMEPWENKGFPGYNVILDGAMDIVFLPEQFSMRKAVDKKLSSIDDFQGLHDVERTWIDLRAVYAQTVNKSQGSTYKKVFIDLDDIRRVNSGNQLARMLYVAVSRASEQVIFTGDLV